MSAENVTLKHLQENPSTEEQKLTQTNGNKKIKLNHTIQDNSRAIQSSGDIGNKFECPFSITEDYLPQDAPAQNDIVYLVRRDSRPSHSSAWTTFSKVLTSVSLQFYEKIAVKAVFRITAQGDFQEKELETGQEAENAVTPMKKAAQRCQDAGPLLYWMAQILCPVFLGIPLDHLPAMPFLQASDLNNDDDDEHDNALSSSDNERSMLALYLSSFNVLHAHVDVQLFFWKYQLDLVLERDLHPVHHTTQVESILYLRNTTEATSHCARELKKRNSQEVSLLHLKLLSTPTDMLHSLTGIGCRRMLQYFATPTAHRV